MRLNANAAGVRWDGNAFSVSPALEDSLGNGPVLVYTRKPKATTTHFRRVGRLKDKSKTIMFYLDMTWPWATRVVSVCEEGLRAAFKRIPLNIYIRKEV